MNSRLQGSKGVLPTIAYLNTVPSYSHFLKEHLRKNEPCLITADLVKSWPALTLWVTTTGTESSSSTSACHTLSQLNLDYIRAHYGDEVVPVAICSSRSFSDQERQERPVREIIDLWKSGNGNGLYVKDWHLAKSMRKKKCPSFYETPCIFRDDWMNAFWEEEGKDDFRFVYMGVAGTFTPLHRDVYTSYSWSTNITGTKLWYLFPPSVSHHLRRFPNRTSSEIVYDVRNVDLEIFKEFDMARLEMRVVEQPPGTTIFVPSGWYHQVENVTDAISVNHNWCNINNLPSMYASLLDAISDVEGALSDVHHLLRTRSGNPEWEREWTEVVQTVLRTDSGWDWIIFWRMICMNLGRLKDPFMVSNPVWPLTPETLRPSFAETKDVVERLVIDFTTARSMDITHIPGLSTILETLQSIIST